MANTSGWWKLEINVDELSDADREHIARLIIEGYTEGELAADETEDENEDEDKF